MQIFLKSPTLFSSVRKHITQAKGFTLVELLISIAIIGIVTTIVLVKNGSFESTSLLKSAAYEIALSLREAQIKSVSSTRGSGSFDYPFGVTFTPSQTTYKAFQFGSSTANPVYYDISDPSPDYASDLMTFTVGKGLQIYDVCMTIGVSEDCGIDRLDISFRRPEFKALFYAVKGGSTYSATITSAKIKVNSAGGTNVFVVEVSQLGQISVLKE